MAKKEEETQVEKEEVKPSIKDKYELIEVPTQTSVMIREVGTENIFDERSLLISIANDIAAIKKAIA